MDIESLDVPDAWLCKPDVHPDDRGSFLEWFRADKLATAVGRPFHVVQANHSVSRRGVVRGVHFADVPPGQGKYVYCARGSMLDVIVDLRVGSPSFGKHCTVVLDDVVRCGVFIAEGLGHAFCATSEHASVAYLVTSTYNAAAERTVSPVDPELNLPWPSDVPLLFSDKDRDAPSLAGAMTLGLLPSYEDCLAHYAGLRG
jgi:dTDP-4-dehydrorhamnose 3,5-epimerase